MNINLHIAWWGIPLAFGLAGIALLIATIIATGNEPPLVGDHIPLPNTKGLGRIVCAIILILLGIALFAGHFLH